MVQDENYAICWPMYSPTAAQGAGSHSLFPVADGSFALVFLTDEDLLERYQAQHPSAVDWYELADHAALRDWLNDLLPRSPHIRWFFLNPAPPTLSVRPIAALHEWATRYA